MSYEVYKVYIMQYEGGEHELTCTWCAVCTYGVWDVYVVYTVCMVLCGVYMVLGMVYEVYV